MGCQCHGGSQSHSGMGWDAMYDAHKEFKKLNGHTNVSQTDRDNKVSMPSTLIASDGDSVMVE
jgi:hypothetical protein